MKILWIFCVGVTICYGCLETVFEWKDLEYEFPTQADRDYAIANKLYVEGNGVPIDVDAVYKRSGKTRVFTTIPRFTTGIPFSLAEISHRRKGPGGPILKPYPSYEWHSSHGDDCDGITSVFRVKIDPCKQMWVLDTGRIGEKQHCPPQLLVFDLATNTLIHRYKFPEGQYKPGVSLFVTPIVDIRDPPPHGVCKNNRVYIADVTGYGLNVYDSDIDESWRIENKLLEYTPKYENFTIAGESFTLRDGVLGMTISPPSAPALTTQQYSYSYRPSMSKKEQQRKLYFHALAGVKENAVELEVLDNYNLWKANPRSKPSSFASIGTRTSQSAAEAMDSQGNMFFGLMDPIAIASWNIHEPYNQYKIRYTNPDTLQFASGMKVIRNHMDKEELWVMTCRFQKVMAGTMNRKNDINFRIQGTLVSEMLKL